MAYGKRSKVSDNLYDYSICLLGESGIGKTTLMAEACEQEFGYDGYMIFNAGKEQGVDCLDDYSYEDIEDWKKFDAVTKDIVQNKAKDYPNLKVVVFDTLDQIIEITEPEVIRRWNTENMGAKDFKAAKTMNASWGGFGKAEDKLISVILDKVWDLHKVGVRVWFTGHVKTREIVDPISNQTYTTLSTNMMTKYFNGFKTKMHVVGIACIDRTIETEATGRKNIVNKKDITVNRVKEERRKIVFRDDNYSVDSKSRLVGIVDEVPMDTDAFIQALKDAIEGSKRKDKKKAPDKQETKKELVVTDDIDEPPIVADTFADIDEDDAAPFDIDEPVEEPAYPANLHAVIRKMYKECTDDDMKADVKSIISRYGKLNDVDDAGLKEIYDLMTK